MKTENRSQTLLSITRSKAKMYEYDVPEEHHITIPTDPARLFNLTMGFLGDLAAQTNSEAPNRGYWNGLQIVFNSLLASSMPICNHIYDRTLTPI